MLGSGAVVVMDETTDMSCCCAHARALLRARVVRQVHAVPRGRHVARAHPAPHRRRPRHRARPRPAARRRRQHQPRAFRTRPASASALEPCRSRTSMTTICFVGPSAYVADRFGTHAVPRRVRGQAHSSQPASPSPSEPAMTTTESGTEPVAARRRPERGPPSPSTAREVEADQGRAGHRGRASAPASTSRASATTSA